MTAPLAVPFVDLAARVAAIRAELDEAWARVLDSGWFILGPEVEAFEHELAGALGARDAVTVANGTDALALGLRALGVADGDEVVTTSISAAFTGLAVLMAGGRPVFVDVDPRTLNLDPQRVADAITPRTRAIVPVHLYGHPADMDTILDLARERDIAVLEDACQAHGALYRGRPVGTLAGERGIGALSFYPTKNLGALGDGGALLVNDPGIAARLRQLRNGGQSDRYRHATAGVNSRLDELQAAFLRAELRHLPAWNERRRGLAAFFARELRGAEVEVLGEQPYARAVYHLFVVRHSRRDALIAALKERGVCTLIHYPIPLHLQEAFASLGGRPGERPVAERASAEILSLPLYPELTDEKAGRVVEAVRAAAKQVC
ncbi:MAG TPA: DegT/DnrJ/EryC1/StrS family aminotransferase [Vicinamibacteria bacterium]|nr:DegT/DnrJ/EryC1/StrS family aminotransferase [Vicinamibacteria bacterium]